MPDADQPLFLTQEPPHWAARGLASCLLVLFAVAAAVSALVRVPETVSSRFVLVPVRGTDPIRAPRGGILAEVRAAEGQQVQRGEPIFVIRSSAVADRSAERQGLETQLGGAEESRTNARQQHESQRRADAEEAERLARRAAVVARKLEEQQTIRAVRQAKFRADLTIHDNEIEIARREMEFKRTAHALAAEVAERLEREHRAGGVSWLETNTRRLEASKLSIELQQLDRVIETLRLKVNQLTADEETRESEWKLTVGDLEAEGRDARLALEKLRHTTAAREAEYRELDRRLGEEAAKARFRAAALREELGQSQGGELRVSASCTGAVIRVGVKAAGAVVHEGEVMGEVACAGGGLEAELTVPPGAVSRTRPGQGVKLLYDAFPYQRHGVRFGAVRWVSPAAVTENGAPVFRALASITDEAIMIDGQARPLIAGMGGRADIVVGRRTLLGYALQPLRQLRESLAMPPAKPQ